MKTRMLPIFLLFVFTMQNISSQSELYREIQNQKENIAFQQISPFRVSKENNISLLNQFQDKDEILFFRYSPLSMKSAGKAIDMEIPLSADRKMEIEIVDVTDTYRYEVVTDKGHRYPPNKNITHYRGIVKDNANSIVALTCFENEIMGIIATEKGNFNIAYDKVTGLHVFYNDRNLKDKYPFLCSTADDESVTYDAKVLLNSPDDILPDPSNTPSTRSATFNIKYVRLYFETEFDIYQAHGNSVSSVEAFVTALYNQVAALYRNEGIFTTLSEIHVWTTTDPYTENNTSALLTNFQNVRTSINGDIGQLLNFRGLGGGIAAGFNALCNASTRQKLSVSSITQFFNAVPTYSRTIKVMTHEFGHLLGSRHTHACVWNGNNTAIDGCASPEGNCTRPTIPTNGGTIMSYCDHPSSGSSVDFNLGFGAQPGNVIRNNVSNATCLQSYSVQFIGASTICGQNSYTYTIQTPPPNTTVTWSASNNSMTLQSGQGTATAVFRQTGFTNGEIRAAIAPFTILRLPVTICQPSLSGPSTVCNQATYTVENLPPGATVQWSADQALQILNQNNVSATVRAVEPSMDGTIRAFISTGSNPININKGSIKTGVLMKISGDKWVGCNKTGTWTVSFINCPLQEMEDFEWTFTNQTTGRILVFYGPQVSLRPSCTNSPMPSDSGQPDNFVRQPPDVPSTYYDMEVKTITDSGISYYAHMDDVCIYGYLNLSPRNAGSSDNVLTLYPNPATDVVTVRLEEESPRNSAAPPDVIEIQLWSAAALIRTYKTDQSAYQISVSDLPRGMYFVRVTKDGKIHTQKLLKN